MHVFDVCFHHAHATPGHAIPNCVHKTVLGHIREKLAHGLLIAVVIISHHFQVAHDAITGMRVFVGQLDDVFAVVTERFTPLGFDNDGTVGAIRLLKTRVAVEPVGARLLDGKFVGKGFTRLDARETDTWYSILIERKDQTVPVNGRHLIQIVGHVDPDVFAFFEAHHRPRRYAIVSNAFFHEIASINFYPVDRQVVLTSHNHGWHQQA